MRLALISLLMIPLTAACADEKFSVIGSCTVSAGDPTPALSPQAEAPSAGDWTWEASQSPWRHVQLCQRGWGPHLRCDHQRKHRVLGANFDSPPHQAPHFKASARAELYTCGVTTSGSIECWGQPGESTPKRLSSERQRGRDHTCGVTTAEASNAGGQLCWQSTSPSGSFQNVSSRATTPAA